MIRFRKWLVISSVVFCLSIIVGALLPFEISAEAIAPLGELGIDLESLSAPVIFIIILINNIVAVLFSFVMSPLLCIIPVLSLLINGVVIGMVSSMVLDHQSFGFLIAGLLPHGIFEIPALILGLSAALSFGSVVTLSIFKKPLRDEIMPSLYSNLKYLVVAIGLLIPAAFVEAFITPLFMDIFI